MRLKGELTASTDVEIRGEMEGTLRLDGHQLTVSETGLVMAEVAAKSVRITGRVVGNVSASERILIGSGGCVLGDLCAPSIQLEDGSRFTGGINRQCEPAKVSGRLGTERSRREARYDR